MSDEDESVKRFEQLSQLYDEQHGHGTTLQLKDELGLGSGPFNEQLPADEIEELNQELVDRLSLEE